jgi:hypothetical protein
MDDKGSRTLFARRGENWFGDFPEMIGNSVPNCGLPLLQFVRNFDIRFQNVNAEPDYKTQFPRPTERGF